MDSVQAIKSNRSLILDLPPSCIQFSPAHPDLFVVGTYNLEREENPGEGSDAASESEINISKPQSRNGSLLLFRLQGDELSAPVDCLWHDLLADHYVGHSYRRSRSRQLYWIFGFIPPRMAYLPLHQVQRHWAYIG
jgi:hypothetical protein